MNKSNISSRLELLDKLPFQIQIEIAENMFRKDSTESEKAEIQKLLKPYFEIMVQYVWVELCFDPISIISN